MGRVGSQTFGVRTWANTLQAKTTDQQASNIQIKGGIGGIVLLHYSFFYFTYIFRHLHKHTAQLTRPNTIQGGSEDKQWPIGINNRQHDRTPRAWVNNADNEEADSEITVAALGCLDCGVCELLMKLVPATHCFVLLAFHKNKSPRFYL